VILWKSKEREVDVLQDDSQFVHMKGEEERVLIDCSLCETYGESESVLQMWEV
jgi:hypothetical protein